MFPKNKASTVPSDNQTNEKLANHVYEYLIHVGAPKAAQAFLQEIHWEKSWPIGEPPGFLNQWWCVFFDLYSAAPERRETFEHSSEAKAFHDYGFVNSGFPNGLARNPSIASPISGGMPPSGGRPPSSQGITPQDNGIHTPVSIPGGQMMVPGPFFAPNHPMSNLNPQQMDMMRNRSMMHPGIRFPPGPIIGNYHPNTVMSRHRFNQPQQQQSSSGIVHSPGPSGTPQTGPTIMPSPNDNDIQLNTSSGQQDSFGHINGSSSASSLTRSPSHVMSQPAPAFPPPPASENNSDQSSHANNNTNNMMNGNNGPSQMSQFSQQQSHTMEYMPSFESPQSMKHSPQQLHNPTMNDVIASMNNGLPNEFCQPMMPNGPPSSLTPFSSEHAMRVSQSSLHMGMTPISQIHMMQQSLGSHHGGSLAMQSMPGQVPSIPGSFMAHPGGPLNNNPSFPVRDDY